MASVSKRERSLTFAWWQNHLQDLLDKHIIQPNEAEIVGWWVNNPKNISFDLAGGYRPGKLGQWDLYYNLPQAGISPDRARILSGLSTKDIDQANLSEAMSAMGTNDTALFNRLNDMSESELDAEISRLEAMLHEIEAKDDLPCSCCAETSLVEDMVEYENEAYCKPCIKEIGIE